MEAACVSNNINVHLQECICYYLLNRQSCQTNEALTGLWSCLKARLTSACWCASSRCAVAGLESRWQQQGAETRGRGQVQQEVTEPLTSCLLKSYQTHKSVSKCVPIYRPVHGPTSTSHEFSAAALDLVRLQLPLYTWHQSKSVSSWTQI